LLPIISWRVKMVTSRKPYQYEAVLSDRGQALDDGQWLKPLMAGVPESVRFQPEARTVARIRERVLNAIERQSTSLVA
jgi:hypothetical protein